MKPHPRIRKTVKWGGAMVSVILLVVWVGSSRWMAAGATRGGFSVSVTQGVWSVATIVPANPAKAEGGFVFQHFRGYFRWWFTWYAWKQNWSFGIPGWIPVLAAIVVSATGFRLDTLARRRARAGLCPKCNYNRGGLPPQAVCPECGAAALAPPPAAS